jgi:flagellar M-ring protein FliF
MPASRKVSIAFIAILMIAGFALMFTLANRVNYQVLFNNLSPGDAGAVVSKLKERNIPYQVEANGTMIMVPAGEVYELRLALASDGLPRGGNVGFEIFDQTDFRTTKFVQELNYRRALQGELARTINEFKEVNSSRVFIVLSKESLFIEESNPASASIQLDLGSSLLPTKLTAIVHLVASAVEGLEPGNVTVVDTKGRVIFKGGGDRDDTYGLLNNAQLDYKGNVENEIRRNIQSMLEGIVGPGKAIVRVYADIDFDRITLNEEEYDPAAPVVRSTKEVVESSESSEGGGESAEELINKRRGVIPPSAGSQEKRTKRDVTTNYEINKISRTIFKPAGKIKLLSVAAVIDGSYKVEKLTDGSIKRTYIPRTNQELKTFEDIVKKAMGYSEDREDQVSVSSIPFSGVISLEGEVERGGEKFDILKLVGSHRKTIINLVLAALVFFFIVRPLLKSIKKMGGERVSERKELPPGEKEYTQIPEKSEGNPKEKVLEASKRSPKVTEQVVKGWIGEAQ